LHWDIHSGFSSAEIESGLDAAYKCHLGSSMSVLRASVCFAGIIACLMFSGLGLYSVSANGQPETVINGYAVVAAYK
jgi:hypothetical protein